MKLPDVFCEISGNKTLIQEFKSYYSNRMIGELRNDCDRIQLGCMDATDCVPTGGHKLLERTQCVIGQYVVR